jgi:hypothetical protein
MSAIPATQVNGGSRPVNVISRSIAERPLGRDVAISAHSSSRNGRTPAVNLLRSAHQSQPIALRQLSSSVSGQFSEQRSEDGPDPRQFIAVSGRKRHK